MAGEVADLYVVLRTIHSAASAGLRQLGADAEESTSKLMRARQALSTLGGAATLALGVAAVASVKMAASFDQEMAKVHTQAGASTNEVKKLSGAVLDLAPTVGIGPTKLAEGLYHVESAGFRGATAMEILKAAAKDAAIGQSDLESTTQALIGTMAVGFTDVKNAADAGAYLNSIVGIGDMRMQKLAQAISTGVLPSFKSAGLGMKDFGAALATLTDNVTPADEAATRLRMTVALMSAPSNSAAGALAKIGMTSDQMAVDMRKPNGLLVAIMDLKSHLEATYPASQKFTMSTAQKTSAIADFAKELQGSGETAKQQQKALAAYKASIDQTGNAAVMQHQVLEKAFGGGRTSGAILTLIEETDRLKSKYQALGTAGSRAAQMQESWRTQQKQFTQQMNELKAAAEKVAIQFGNFLIPPIQALFSFLQKHQTVVKVMAVLIGSLLVAAMMAFTYSVIQSTVALMANPITWIVLAIVAAIALLAIGIYELIKHFGAVKKALNDYLVQPMKAAWSAIVGVWDGITGWFSRLWDSVASAFMSGWHAIIDPPLGYVKKRIDEFKEFWRQHGEEIKQITNEAWKAITFLIRFWWGTVSGPIKAGFAVLKGIFKAGWETIKFATQIEWQIIKTTILLAWAAITLAVRLGWTALVTLFRVDKDILVGIWHTIWTYIGDVFNIFWHALLNTVGLFADLLTGKWSKLGGDLKKLVGGIAHDILKVFTDLAGNLIGTVTKAGGDTLRGLSNGARAVWHYITDTTNDIKNAVTNMANDAKNWLYNAGQDIVRGLWNGVKSMGGWIKDKLGGFASDALGSLKHGFGLWSPSRHTREHGRMLVQGLALGIADEQHRAIAAARGLAASVLTAANPGEMTITGGALGLTGTIRLAGPSAAAAAAQNDQPIVIQQTVNLDGKQVFRATIPYAQRHKNRNTYTALT